MKYYLQKEWAGLMNGYIYSMVNVCLTTTVGVKQDIMVATVVRDFMHNFHL